MRKLFENEQYNKGVSPVISVVLLVAIVVALAGLVTFVAFNFSGGETDDSVAGGAVDFTATTDGVKVKLLRKGDANNYTIRVDGQDLGTLEEPGDVETIQAEGLYAIVGQFDDTEEVIVKKSISGVIEGLFTVFQDQQDGTVEAQLVERYQNSDKYDLVVNADNETDTTTTSYEFSFQEDGTELLSERNTESRLLGPPEGLPARTPEQGADIMGITAFPDEKPQPAQVGQKIQVHELLGSWCKGDDLLLEADDGTTILDGDEFKFDNNCGGLRAIPEYNQTEITGAQVVNLWQESVNYTVFAYQGEVEPPKKGTIETGDYKLDVEVFEKGNSDNKIDDAKVVVGNKAGTTDNQGRILFDPVPGGQKYFITVNAPGYEGTQATFNLSESSGTLDSITLTPDPSYGSNYGTEIDATNDTVDITVGLPKFTQEVTEIDSGTIDPGEEITYDYSSGTASGVDTDSSTTVGFSGGGGSGFGGGDSYSGSSGGSISSGSSVYSSGGGSSTQTLSATASAATEGGDYTPEPANPIQDVDEDPPSEIINEPQRVINVIPIDDSIVPTGEEIKVQASAQTYADQSVNETIRLYKSRTGVDQDPQRISNLDSNLTLPPGEPGNEQTVEIQFEINSTATNGEFLPGEEYVLFAALESNGQLEEAGTIDVINGDLTASDLDTSSSTIELTENASGQPTDREIGNAVVGDNLSIELSNIVAGGPEPGETIDLFRNGELVKRVEGYDGSQDPITYEENLSEAQYVDYHVGIKESQNTTLLGTAVVSEIDPEADSPENLNLDPNLTLNNPGECESSIYDCEFEVGTTLNFSIDGTFESGGSSISDSELDTTLKVGSEDTVSLSSPRDEYHEHTFSKGSLQLIELNVQYTDSAGNQIEVRDTLTVNSYTNRSEMTSYLAQDPYITNQNDKEVELAFDIQNNRTTVDEKVDLTITSECTSSSCSDNGGEYKISDFRVQEGVQNIVKTTVSELAWKAGNGGIYTDTSQNETYAISQITNDNGDIPLNIEISPVSVDGQPLSDDSKSTSFNIGPNGQIDANISANVLVNQCPSGTDSYISDSNNDPNYSNSSQNRFFCDLSTCDNELSGTCEDKQAP
jgi:flagellin-like protein